MSTLRVWVEGASMGELSAENGVWRFAYADAWLQSPGCFVLSPRFPLAAIPVQDSAEERPVQWFFDNLLPEGGVRQALAAYARISERDSFGLLSRFGEENAGALTLLPPEQPLPQEGRYLPLSTERLRALIAAMPQVPLIAAAGQAKMSLPGAQHKMGVRFEDGAFSLPQAAASSHILKPDNARVQDYPFCPANEHFCMQLARAAGLPVPQTWLVHLPEPVYVVARYDRYLDGTKVRRLHQIDLCQLLNKWSGYKYEAQGGASFAEAYGALEKLRQPAVARERALRWLVFNYLIGNSDAHAKNLAFLVSAQGFELAPFYDLLCAKAYGDDTLAMTIGGEVCYGWITAKAWDAQAKSLGLPPAFLSRMRVSMARALPGIARQLAAEDVFTEPERAFLAKVVAIIGEHAGWVLEAD